MTDRELEAKAAEVVMGWRTHPANPEVWQDSATGFAQYKTEWHPLKYSADSKRLRDAMRAKGFLYAITDLGTGEVSARFSKPCKGMLDLYGSAVADTEERAVLLAALEACRG